MGDSLLLEEVSFLTCRDLWQLGSEVGNSSSQLLHVGPCIRRVGGWGSHVVGTNEYINRFHANFISFFIISGRGRSSF